MTYNPKQTLEGRTAKERAIRFYRQKTTEELEEAKLEEEQDVEEKDLTEEEVDKTPELRFETFKVDMTTDVTQEFMCPFGESSLVDKDRFVHLQGVHLFSLPMMTKCCGNSACFECFKYIFALQLGQSDSIQCPFCGKQ